MILARIDSMAYGGYGVTRVEGFVHFVPESAPGDLVEIEPVVRKKSHGFSRLVRMLEPSPLRTDPFCPYYGECGGCQYQHIRYPEQLKIKQEIFVDQTRRLGRLPDLPSPQVVGSETKRIRMRFQVRQGELGLFRKRSHTLCPIQECAIASADVNAVLKGLRTFRSRNRAAFSGTISVLASPAGALVSLTLLEEAARDLYGFLGRMVQGCTIVNPGARIVLGEPYLAMPVQGLRIFVPPDAFWQVNPEINEILVGMICEFMQGSDRVMDLYCGCGNITLPLSRVCGHVVGIEWDRPSIEAARHSASEAGIGNASFFEADALKAEMQDADGMVLDPPRSGLPAALIRKITGHRLRKIAYVSCNPSTLARDLRLFVESGYRVISIRLLDMFPHTHHIESMVFLTSG